MDELQQAHAALEQARRRWLEALADYEQAQARWTRATLEALGAAAHLALPMHQANAQAVHAHSAQLADSPPWAWKFEARPLRLPLPPPSPDPLAAHAAPELWLLPDPLGLAERAARHLASRGLWAGVGEAPGPEAPANLVWLGGLTSPRTAEAAQQARAAAQGHIDHFLSARRQRGRHTHVIVFQETGASFGHDAFLPTAAFGAQVAADTLQALEALGLEASPRLTVVDFDWSTLDLEQAGERIAQVLEAIVARSNGWVAAGPQALAVRGTEELLTPRLRAWDAPELAKMAERPSAPSRLVLWLPHAPGSKGRLADPHPALAGTLPASSRWLCLGPDSGLDPEAPATPWQPLTHPIHDFAAAHGQLEHAASGADGPLNVLLVADLPLLEDAMQALAIALGVWSSHALGELSLICRWPEDARAAEHLALCPVRYQVLGEYWRRDGECACNVVHVPSVGEEHAAPLAKAAALVAAMGGQPHGVRPKGLQAGDASSRAPGEFWLGAGSIPWPPDGHHGA